MKHPHLEDSCVCVAVCVGEATFDALALEEASFSCLSAPSLPPLAIRTGSAELPNEPPHPHSDRPGSWSADDAANAPCQIDDCCPSACTPLPACVWFPDCVVGALLAAEADDSASFDCDTVPPFPQLAMRIGPLSFVAPICFAEENPAASWPISLDCPSACTAGPEEQPQLEGP